MISISECYVVSYEFYDKHIKTIEDTVNAIPKSRKKHYTIIAEEAFLEALGAVEWITSWRFLPHNLSLPYIEMPCLIKVYKEEASVDKELDRTLIDQTLILSCTFQRSAQDFAKRMYQRYMAVKNGKRLVGI